MSPAIQWALIALGVLGASGTWFRAWVAYKEHRSQERIRNIDPWSL